VVVMAAVFRAALALALAGQHSNALPSSVRAGDRKIYVDGKPFHMKGVNWNPVPVGKTHPHGLEFAAHVVDDARAMAEAGINVIRTYEPIIELEVLDTLWKSGIQVLNTVYAHGAKPFEAVVQEVEAVKHHPAILMWVAGNEWNYNGCYQKLDLHSCGEKLNTIAKLIKQHDSLHPVASIYGEAPPSDVIQRLDGIDVWGINYYDELSFGDLFKRWAERSAKPLFIGEYGADAYDSNNNEVNEEAQAHATKVLTEEIMDNSVVWESGVCSGGLVFELADEWWKDGSGSPHEQDAGGVAPGGGPYPDQTFNEEWWGLLTLHRQPRKAYYAYAALAVPQPQLAEYLILQGGNASEGVRKSCTIQGCTLVPRSREEFCPRQGCGFSSRGQVR